MTYVRDPYDTDEPPCVCGHTGPVLTTEEYCPAHGDPDKPVPECRIHGPIPADHFPCRRPGESATEFTSRALGETRDV